MHLNTVVSRRSACSWNMMAKSGKSFTPLITTSSFSFLIRNIHTDIHIEKREQASYRDNIILYTIGFATTHVVVCVRHPITY